MAVTSTSDLNGLYNTIYDGALMVARAQNLMTNLVDQRSATGWMNRVVPIRPAITAVTVGETEDYNDPTTFGKSTKATITPQEIVAQAVLTDRDMETDPDPAIRDAMLELGGAIATKIDVDLLGAFSSFTTDKGTGAGNAATVASLGAAMAVLSNNKAMQYGTPSAVLHPYHWHDIWLELGKPSATYPNLGELTNEALRSYWVGQLMGLTFYTSPNIAVDGSSDAISAIFVPASMMIDTRRAPRMETERDASARATELNITAGYGYGVVRTEFGVKYTADASEPS